MILLLIFSIVVLCGGVSYSYLPPVDAFSSIPSLADPPSSNLVEIEERTPRNIVGLKEWAKDCGVESCSGFRLVSDPIDEEDWSVSTTKALATNDIVVKIPSQILLTSSQIESFLQDPRQYESFQQAQQYLVDNDGGSQQHIPLFQIYLIILVHYEMGKESPYYEWLDSLPRRFYGGVTMTSACFESLPPYVRRLSEQERDTCRLFQNTVATMAGGGVLSETTTSNTQLLKWAYCVAVTRSWEFQTADGQMVRIIAPMADMFNHGSFDNEVGLTFDEDGNCIVYATRNVSAGTTLSICYGDPSNPSVFFATYGFLDKASPAMFCKLIDLQDEMIDLNLKSSNLLFYRSGEISNEVWDLLLYSILKERNDHQEFLNAIMTGDDEMKNAFHQQYFSYTLDALKSHCDGILAEIESLSSFAKTKDIAEHPRLPLIRKHNQFVKATFQRVRTNLEAMSP